MTVVKICGITRSEHGRLALELGADLLGFIFYPPSHRYITPEAAGELVSTLRRAGTWSWGAVGVFVNEQLDHVNEVAQLAGLDFVQLAGDESPEYCQLVRRSVIKVVRVDNDGEPAGPTDPLHWNAQRILLDTQRSGSFGGTGEAYRWTGVRLHASQALLAGGLSPVNVRTALIEAAPWGVDVSSGVECEREKHPERIRAFIEEVRRHDNAH